MLDNDLFVKKEHLIENYLELKRVFGWKVDKRILLTLASQYAGNQKIVDMNSLKRFDSLLKDEVGFFTTLDSSVRRSLAALMDTTVDNPVEAVLSWRQNYDLLVENKFARGDFTFITAYQLLFIPNHEKEEVVRKAIALYKGLRKKHFFLTGNEDYPAVLMLATLKQPEEVVLETISTYYEGLSKRGFSKGNELQFLANILTFSKENPDVVMDRVVKLRERFKHEGIKIRKTHFTSLGILGLLVVQEVEIQSIVKLIIELQSESILRWKKDLATSLGIDLFVKNQVKDNSLLDTGLLVALQTIIQAEQAATIVAASVAMSSSSSSSSSC